jgi:glycosyltransferase involved in cell wall biosynthesis
VLLGALDRLRPAPPRRPFRVVAVGSGDFEREYRAETERRGAAGTVSFLPRVAEAAPVLRALDIVAMPSLWEAAGLLAMEALAVGTPLVASDCLGLREVVAGTPARVVRSGDEAAWADALRAAIDDPRRAEAAAFAPEARRRFDAAVSARKTAALLAEIEAAGSTI